MLRTNPGFWFLCAVLQGNSPPAFSLVFLFLPFLSFYLFLSLSFSFTLSVSLSFIIYIHIHNVHMFIYLIHITLQKYVISFGTCVIFADMIEHTSILSSFISLLHSFRLSSYTPFSLTLSCASFSRVATFFRSPSICSI